MPWASDPRHVLMFCEEEVSGEFGGRMGVWARCRWPLLMLFACKLHARLSLRDLTHRTERKAVPLPVGAAGADRAALIERDREMERIVDRDRACRP